MSEEKVINEASRSTQAIIYQFYVALERCFEMGPSECVVVERLGDVTVPGVSQSEVKLYSDDDPLTNTHPNFWKSIRNWMDNVPNAKQYHALILHTNQSYSSTTLLKEWNQCSTARRLEILEEIFKISEKRFQDSGAAKPSKVHSFQRQVMEGSNRENLEEVVKRLVIADESMDLGQTYQKLLNQYCPHIPESNRPGYLGALLELVLRPEVIENSWVIKKSEFDANAQKIAAKFILGSRRFPDKYRCSIKDKLTPEHDALRGRPFVIKILEIQHGEHLTQALKDYLFTQKTILEDFSAYSAEEREYQMFADDIESSFILAYQTARQKVTSVVKDSQAFFNEIIREASPSFSGRENPHRDFKNGVLHMHLDNESKLLKWKLAD